MSDENPPGFDVEAYRERNPEAWNLIERVMDDPELAARLEKNLAAAASDTTDADEPDPVALVSKATRPLEAKLETMGKVVSDLNEERLARKSAEDRNRVLGEIDALVSKDEVLGDYPEAQRVARAVTLYEATEGGHKTVEDAYKAALPRLRGMVDHGVKKVSTAKNPPSGLLESGSGAPASAPPPDREVDSGGFGKGLSDALKPLRAKRGA